MGGVLPGRAKATTVLIKDYSGVLNAWLACPGFLVFLGVLNHVLILLSMLIMITVMLSMLMIMLSVLIMMLIMLTLKLLIMPS